MNEFKLFVVAASLSSLSAASTAGLQALSRDYSRHKRPYHGDPLARRTRRSSLPSDAGAVKAATTWEAPSASDKQFKQAIQASEIDNGPDSPATAQTITAAAKYYVQTKQWQKAAPLLQRLDRLGVSDAETNSLRQQVNAGLQASGLGTMHQVAGVQQKSTKSSAFKQVRIEPPSDFSSMRRGRHRKPK